MKLKLNAVNIKNRRATFDFDIVEIATLSSAIRTSGR